MPQPCLSRKLLRLLAWMVAAGCAAWGQGTWRSSLYPSNWQPPGPSTSFATAKLIQDFSYAGYRRGEQLLPNVTGPVFDVTDFGADSTGASASTTAIQNAIDAAAAAGGGVVFLPAGTYRVAPPTGSSRALRISSSNIVLRGAGTTRTFLLNTSSEMNDKSVILVSPSSGPSLGTPRNITANLPGPTHRIPVENAGSFARGNIVRLQWNFTSDWVTENNQQTWWGVSRPGSAVYFREVTAVDENAGWIEVDVPTRYWIKTRESPTVRTISGLLRNVGIESLSIGNVQHPGSGWGEEDYQNSSRAAYDAHNSWLIRFENLRDSWITGVSSYQASGNTSTCHMLSNGIRLLNCLRVTVQDCQMRRPQYGGGGGNGYMFRLQSSNECLIRNCIADFSRHGFVISHAGTSGNVFLQCEDRNTARATGSTSSGYTTDGEGSDNHQYFSHSNLWDQCHAHNSFFTAHHRLMLGGTPPHGVTSAQGVYWNTSGSGTRYADSANPIVRSEQLEYGYIIGTRATDGGSAYFTSIPTGGNTSPADHREGVNTGAGLQPQSLYLDQLTRRLRPTVSFNTNGGSAHASIQVVFTATYGPLPVPSRAGFSFAGWFTAPTGGSQVSAGTMVTNSADHTLFASWNAFPSVDAGPDQTVAATLLQPWTPGDLVTSAWFDAADPGTLSVNGGTVSEWRDKSGNPNHASQGTASRRPATGSATIGGWNAVAFDPFRNQHLAAPHHESLNLDGRGGANLFAVFDSSGYVSRGSGLNSIVSKGTLLTAGAAYGIRLNENSRMPFKAGDGFIASPEDSFVSRALIYGATRHDSTGTASIFIDGLERGAANAPSISSNNSSPLILGGESTTSRCADVRLGEFIIVPGTVSEHDRRKMEGYLAHKWSLASRLPADHPHKASPPVNVARIPLAGAATDGENDPLSFAWSMVSGPAPVTFASSSAANTTATFPMAGTWVLRLSASDGSGSQSDEVTITVNESLPSDPFVRWSGNPPATFMQDSNSDGLADGLAWLLGARNPTDSSSSMLPLPGSENGALAVTFHQLTPAHRGTHALRLQFSNSLDPGSWSEVGIPDSSGTVGGVGFVITPTADPGIHQVRAVVPAGPAGRAFVRLRATAPDP